MESAIRITTDNDRIATLTMDLPGKSVNTCAPQLLAELNEALSTIERDRPAGVIFASAKARSFNAGADLFEIRKMSREAVAEYLATGQKIFDRISKLPMPTIAAINGDCMGGGFELALACTYRVAADETSINIGLPETKLGLIPAWGGTSRLPRLIGLTKALPILLAGKTMPPRKAQRAGLVDEVVRPEALLAAAKRIVTARPKPHRPGMLDRAITPLAASRNKVLAKARESTLALTHGNYPAPMKLLDVINTSYTEGFARGLEEERKAILEMTSTDTGKNLLRLFFLKQGAKKWAADRVNAKPHEIKHAAVIGGGTMGAGIVHSLIRAGIPVRLVEVNPPAVSAALGRISKMLGDDVGSGKLTKLAARDAFNRVSPTTDWTGLELADFVVEAVLETIEAKREVFAKLDRLTRPDCVLASNTSSLRISEMAQATLHPERVVGLHFFNPVPKMPLVEVVRGPQSDDASLATAIALTSRIGKTPVLVNDAPGFVVNRILIPYLAEAVIMAEEGADIVAIDRAMKAWGMPMGPFELLDEIGLDIGAHVLKSLAAKNAPNSAIVEKALNNKWLGKKTGRGFYIYDPKKKAKPQLNAELFPHLAAHLGGRDSATSRGASPAAKFSDEEIQWRLVLPMVNETTRLLEDDVTDSTDAIDLATVLGTGFAPFRGGIVNFANTVGAEQIVRRLDELTTKHGPRFAPSDLLREVAASHRPIAHMATFANHNENTQHPVHT